jgi:IclR family KDG regulon transcriptional repressor
VRAYVPIGGRAPASSVATGKAILAFLAGAAPSPEYKLIRKRGFAVNSGEWEEGVGGIAAPIFDERDDVVASIGVVLPSSRFASVKAADMGRVVAASAVEISRSLGYGSARKKRAG